ncbi:uncharacterized protein LOC133517683 [Cydia pomonella]|uniref:uncharacterized protein LOC133517683 n=1 Tax=Cydia pomonella TaxID=82600 RepID=UPI002ADD5514|nr:uncharacterized protein LOC133517683 [Cydia pomonella]
MENNDEPPTDKKSASRAKSSGAPSRRNARRMLNVNEAVRSLDLALCSFKKRTAVPNCGPNNSQSGPLRHSVTAVDMDALDFPCSTTGMDNGSLMSMNFSHYELIRNLSRSNNSEGAFSDTTNKLANPMDLRMKREHLERYFRSAEMWSHARPSYESGSVSFDIPEK